MYHSYYSMLKSGKIKYPLGVVRYPPKYISIPNATELGCPERFFKLPKEVWEDKEFINRYCQGYRKMLDKLGVEGLFKIIRKYYPDAPIEEICFMSYTKEPDQRKIICDWLSEHGYPSQEFKGGE